MEKNDNNEYFEIKKIDIQSFEKIEKQQKAFLLRNDIALGVMSVVTSTIIGLKGYNPFLAFIELYTLPISLLVLSNIKILSALKNKKMEIKSELEAEQLDSDNISRGK